MTSAHPRANDVQTSLGSTCRDCKQTLNQLSSTRSLQCRREHTGRHFRRIFFMRYTAPEPAYDIGIAALYGQLSRAYTTLKGPAKDAAKYFEHTLANQSVIGSRPSDHYFRSVCLFVCLCRVFLSRLWSDFDQTRTLRTCLYVWV